MIYENDGDRAAENEIAFKFRKAMRFDGFRKLPMSYRIDYAMLRNDPKVEDGRVIAYAECKDRDYAFGHRDGYRLAESKARAAYLYRVVDGLPSYVVVRFNDGIIRWCPMNVYRDDIIIAGRSDRPNDPGAMEPHVIFDWVMFKEI